MLPATERGQLLKTILKYGLGIFLFAFALPQDKSGKIKVRKQKSIVATYQLQEGTYYAVKSYLRIFDDKTAVFLNAPITPQRAKDSTAQLLYTYHKKPSTVKVVNDSVFISGTENKLPFLFKGIYRNKQLMLKKYYNSKVETKVFKAVL